MKKNVCMYVWNHFTNDARVLRECTALSENGYKVDLICIHDPSDPELPKEEKVNENFNVFRVRRYPLLLEGLQKLSKNKWLAIPFIAIWLALVYFFPIFTIALTLFGLVVLKTKLKIIWIRGEMIIRMIAKGYRKKYDIYHANDLNTLPQAYITSKFRLRKKQLVYDSHEVQTSRTGYDSPLHGKLEAFLIKKIDSMIVENHTRAKYNEDLYGFYPNVVHNYPFKQDVINEKVNLHELLDLPVNEKILLYQGGVQTGRGLEHLVEAMPHINEGTLVFIGDGKIKPYLEKLVTEKGLDSRIKFLPKVPLNDLPKYTRNAYLGFQVLNNVCFNHYSASSNKLFEYMMSEVPVIACDFPEIQRVVEGEKIGLTVDSHDYQSIASGVNQLLENEPLRSEFSENCKVARLKYNWNEEKDNLLSVYYNL